MYWLQDYILLKSNQHSGELEKNIMWIFEEYKMSSSHLSLVSCTRQQQNVPI